MMATSAMGVIVSVSVASLGVGSTTPGGTCATTRLMSCRVASGATLPVSEKVTEPPDTIVTVVAITSVPFGWPQALGWTDVQVHVTLVRVTGGVSVTVAPVTSLGPLFETTIVYVVCVPGTTVVVPLSLVTERSAMGAPSDTDACPVLFSGSGSGVRLVAVATFVIRRPVKFDGTWNVTLIVRLVLGARLPSAHGKAAQTSLETKSSPVTGGSVTTTLVAVDGPWLVTTSANITSWPGAACAGGAGAVRVLASVTSADGVIVVLSVDVSFVGSGSVVPAGGVTVAMFVSVPVAAGFTVALTVKVTAPPTGRFTVVAMSPAPLAVPQVAVPAVVARVQLTFWRNAGPGNVSMTVAPRTLVGPRFETTIV